jgi:hypothetical protein
MQKILAISISILITILFFINFYFFSSNLEYLFVEKQSILIDRVIDGDTFVSSNVSYRLLNINTPEKGTPESEQATNFLKSFQGKSITIYIYDKDKYGRKLVKMYSNKTYLNLELIKKGFSTKFLVRKNEKSLFKSEEEKAILLEKGMWKKSEFQGCIKSEINWKEEYVTLINKCQEIKNISIRDESRKYFFIESIKPGNATIFSKDGSNQPEKIYLSSQNIWNDDYDTLYVFDEKRRIIHFQAYGY